MSIQANQFDPQAMLTLLSASLGELRQTPTSYGALRARLEALQQAVDGGRVDRATINAVRKVEPQALKPVSRIMRTAMRVIPSAVSVQRPSANAHQPYPNTRELLNVLRNHAVEIEQSNWRDLTRPRPPRVRSD